MIAVPAKRSQRAGSSGFAIVADENEITWLDLDA